MRIERDRVRASAWTLVVAALAACGESSPAFVPQPFEEGAGTVVGPPTVLDAQTVKVRGHKIRLWGIEAPSADHACGEATGERWPCGREAASALKAWIHGRSLNCSPRGRFQGETVMLCRISGMDVSEWMVREGWAVDCPEQSDGQYGDSERSAAKGRRGLHRAGVMALTGCR